MLSIVKVDLSGDQSSCKVYVSSMEGMEKARESVKGLTSGAGYIRRELARRVNLRNTPEIRFIVDQSIAYGVKMSKLIDEVNRKETGE